jgi:hypothetical protein
MVGFRGARGALRGFLRAPLEPMTARNPDPYPLRAQFIGMLYWTCPLCGRLNRTRMSPGCWTIHCKAPLCRRLYSLGLQFWHPSPGQRSALPGDPPDAMITATPPPASETDVATRTDPAEPMPAAVDRGTRRIYQPAHSQHTPDPD